MKVRVIVLSFCITYVFSVQSQFFQSIQVQPDDIHIEKNDGYDRVINEDMELKIEKPGYPELPVYKKSFLIPIDASDIKLNIRNVNKQKIAGEYLIYPAQEMISVGESNVSAWTPPRQEIYDSSNAYPGKYGEIVSDYFYLGYRLIDVFLYPFEYIPSTKELYVCEIDYAVDYKSSKNLFKSSYLISNQSNYITELNKRTIKLRVENPELADTYNLKIKNIIQGKCVANASQVKPAAETNILDTYTPEYIIITADSLKESFHPFAQWKTKKGVFTIIQSTEDIKNEYTGNDLQEKIRNYIIDSRNKWGNIYILLGGDIDIVPPRMIPGDSLRDKAGSANHKSLYAADMYYSTYNGTWNNNKNNVYKEVKYGDKINKIGIDLDVVSADYNIGVVLGRLPVKNKYEVSVLTNKIIAYEKATGVTELSYFKNNLYSDAYIVEDKGQLSNFAINNIKRYVRNYATTQTNRYICDNADCSGDAKRYGSYCTNPPNGDIELNRENFLTAINDGSNLDVGHFHFIYHMDHSNVRGIGTSSIDKGQSVNMSDMETLTNAPYYQILMSGSCNSANFYYEKGIAKSYLLNPHGGGVAWIGNTDTGYASEYSQLQYFLRAISERSSIGRAFQESIAGSGYAISKWRLHLLGDPEMQVWTDTPKTLKVTIDPKKALPCGKSTIKVGIENVQNANENVRICLYKKDEVFEPITVQGNGTYTFDNIHPLTPGELYVTVTAHNYIPTEDTITVTTNPNQHVYFKGLVIDDDKEGQSIGNGDGQIDAGETVELSLQLTNNGLKQADNVTASISCTSPYVTITTEQANYGNIAAGQTKTSQEKYILTIDKDAPEMQKDDPEGIVFALEISDGNGNTFTSTFRVEVFNNDIQIVNRTFEGNSQPVAGQTLRFNVDLQNTGKAAASGIKAILKDAAQNTICTRTYPDIASGETKTSTTPYEYTLPASYTGGTHNMTLTVENAYGAKWDYTFNLTETRLSGVAGQSFTADLTSINLYWNAQNGVAGYNVYRCDVDGNGNPIGNYTKLNTDLLTFAYFHDTGLEQLTKYHYRIAAVSASGLEGNTTEMMAWTSLQTKGLFPVKMVYVGMRGGMNTVDVNNDGKEEIFASSREGFLTGLDCEGNELYDIDNNVTTYSGFVNFGWQCDAMPAIGDLYGNGKMLIVQPTRVETGVKTNQLFCFSPEDNNPQNQRPDTVWHVPTNPLKAIALRPAVLANIDNSSDGSLEIIVPYENSDIVIYNADGTERLRLPWKGGYSAIAVADLDGNDTKEIIAATKTGVTAWDYQGNVVWNHTNSNYYFNSSIVVCDLEGDREKEVLTIMLDKSAGIGKVVALNAQGEAVSNWATPQIQHRDTVFVPSLSVGDLNHDGHLEVVANGKGFIDVWNYQGHLISHIIEPLATQHSMNPILADVDDDPDIEIVVASSPSPHLFAYKMNGQLALGFPLTITGKLYSVPTVSDVDNDGKNEIIVSCDDWVYQFQTKGKPENIAWGMERHDPQNTGEYTTPCLSERIMASATWTENKSICGNLTVYPGNTLKIKDCTVDFGEKSVLTIHSGASLEVSAATLRNISIKALPGSSLKILEDGKIYLRKGGVFDIAGGAVVDMTYGAIEHAQ